MPQADQCPHFVGDIPQCNYFTNKLAQFAKMTVQYSLAVVDIGFKSSSGDEVVLDALPLVTLSGSGGVYRPHVEHD